MDSVRFGRALGVGARAAAKTLVAAADAAAAPNPSAGVKTAASGPPSSNASASGVSASGRAQGSGTRVAQQAARTTAQARQTGRGLKEGSKRFGEAVGGPLVKLSGVLWLELTGVFFGIFAVFTGGGAWKMRSALEETAGNHEEHVRFLVAAAMALIFGYFCVSSFVKASRRGRRR